MESKRKKKRKPQIIVLVSGRTIRFAQGGK
jgi:hypothetical protein